MLSSHYVLFRLMAKIDENFPLAVQVRSFHDDKMYMHAYGH